MVIFGSSAALSFGLARKRVNMAKLYNAWLAKPHTCREKEGVKDRRAAENIYISNQVALRIGPLFKIKPGRFLFGMVNNGAC